MRQELKPVPLSESLTMRPSTKEAPLSILEALWHRIHQVVGESCDCALVVTLNGHVQPESMQEALSAVQRRHPKLRARVGDSPSGLVWRDQQQSSPKLPFEYVEVEETALEWKREADRLLDLGLDLETGPPARLTILQSRQTPRAALILVAHHGIVDGLCLMNLAHDLLEFHELAERGESLEEVHSLPLICTNRAKLNGRLSEAAAYLLRRFSQRKARKRGDWTRLPIEDPHSDATQWSLFVLDEEETLALAVSCRKKGASIHGALCAAALLALRDSSGETNPVFRCVSPVNIRSQLNGPSGEVTQQDLGNYAVSDDHLYGVDQDSEFWSLACILHQDIRTFQSRGGAALLYNLTSLLGRKAGLIERRLQQVMECPSDVRRKCPSLLATNLGVPSVREQYGDLTLDSATMIYKKSTGGALLNVLAMVIDGRLNITIHGGGLATPTWTRLRQDMERCLREAALE